MLVYVGGIRTKKKLVSVILLMAMSLLILTSCGGSGTIETEGNKSVSGNGGGNAYVFDIDKISSYTVDSHKNLITIYAYNRSNCNTIHFTDVYVDKDQFEGLVGVDDSKGFSGVTGTTISNGTTVKVKDKNCYIRVGRKKRYMSNVNIKLTKVGQKEGERGKATFSFDWE